MNLNSIQIALLLAALLAPLTLTAAEEPLAVWEVSQWWASDDDATFNEMLETVVIRAARYSSVALAGKGRTADALADVLRSNLPASMYTRLQEPDYREERLLESIAESKTHLVIHAVDMPSLQESSPGRRFVLQARTVSKLQHAAHAGTELLRFAAIQLEQSDGSSLSRTGEYFRKSIQPLATADSAGVLKRWHQAIAAGDWVVAALNDAVDASDHKFKFEDSKLISKAFGFAYEKTLSHTLHTIVSRDLIKAGGISEIAEGALNQAAHGHLTVESIEKYLDGVVSATSAAAALAATGGNIRVAKAVSELAVPVASLGRNAAKQPIDAVYNRYFQDAELSNVLEQYQVETISNAFRKGNAAISLRDWANDRHINISGLSAEQRDLAEVTYQNAQRMTASRAAKTERRAPLSAPPTLDFAHLDTGSSPDPQPPKRTVSSTYPVPPNKPPPPPPAAKTPHDSGPGGVWMDAGNAAVTRDTGLAQTKQRILDSMRNTSEHKDDSIICVSMTMLANVDPRNPGDALTLFGLNYVLGFVVVNGSELVLYGLHRPGPPLMYDDVSVLAECAIQSTHPYLSLDPQQGCNDRVNAAVKQLGELTQQPQRKAAIAKLEAALGVQSVRFGPSSLPGTASTTSSMLSADYMLKLAALGRRRLSAEILSCPEIAIRNQREKGIAPRGGFTRLWFHTAPGEPRIVEDMTGGIAELRSCEVGVLAKAQASNAGNLVDADGDDDPATVEFCNAVTKLMRDSENQGGIAEFQGLAQRFRLFALLCHIKHRHLDEEGCAKIVFPKLAASRESLPESLPGLANIVVNERMTQIPNGTQVEYLISIVCGGADMSISLGSAQLTRSDKLAAVRLAILNSRPKNEISWKAKFQ